MNDDLVRNVAEIIHDIYLQDFLEIYGLTIAIAETHPEQVNNELRNALTHLARALSSEADDPEKELESAKSHIRRAKRDCLKIAILHKRDQILGSIHRIEYDQGILPSKLKTRLKTIEQKRRDVFRSESSGNSVTVQLQEILADVLELGDQILTDHQDPGTIIHGLKKYGQWAFRWARNGSFAILFTLFTTWLGVILFPENSLFVEWGGELLRRVSSLLLTE
ncbi:MAG: hypothetical protein R3F50_11370 [Gammaproteobacteria bacterium]